MSARLRAAVVAAATGMLALATALVAAPAYAATTNGAPVETQTQFCSPSLSARTDVAAITTGLQAQVDQDFHLVVTVAGLNQCLPSQSASVNLQLPAGVAVSSSGQSACVTFASTNPAGTTQTVPCVRSDAGSGFLRVDPQGGNSWTLTRGGRNVVQVQLAVRASTAGQRTAFARVCDSGSTVVCIGSPVANAVPSVAFTVAAAPAPPASITADRLKIRKVGTVCSGGGSCPDLAVTSTSLKVQAYLIGERPAGVWRIQRRGPGTAPFTTIASKTLTAGGGYQSLTTTASGLEPGTTHRFRACFTPTGGAQVCGSEITLTTASA
jgi:hypothetical protein